MRIKCDGAHYKQSAKLIGSESKRFLSDRDLFALTKEKDRPPIHINQI